MALCRGGASKLYGEWIPEKDATVVTRLRTAGAVTLGKAALPELAFSGPRTTRNPWNVQVSAGAASGGCLP